MSKSSRHHFIPKFYLENFVNPDNHFFVYDKQNPNKIFRKSPKQICYETHRNSLFGKANIPIPYLEEKFYGYFDNLHAPIFKSLCNDKVNTNYWTVKNVQTIEFFIPFLFWRNPTNDNLFDDFIQQLDKLEDLNLVIYNGITNEVIEDDKFHKEILGNSDFKKVARIPTAIETFKHKINRFKESEWRVYDYNGFGNFITSDNPLIFKNPICELSDLRGDLIIAISPNRSFMRIDKNKENTFPIPVIQNFSTIHSANRFVISQNKEYLELLVKEYHRFLKNENLRDVLQKLWIF